MHIDVLSQWSRRLWVPLIVLSPLACSDNPSSMGRDAMASASGGGTAMDASADSSGGATDGAGAGPLDASGGTAPVDGSGSGNSAGIGDGPGDGAGGTIVGPDAGSPVPPAPSLIGNVDFTVPSQSFVGELEVAMTSSVAAAEIRYTTNGELPSASSALYESTPLVLTDTTQLRAQPFMGGAAAGSVSTALYIARTFEFSSDVPIVIVDGYGGGKPSDKDVYLDAAVMVFEPMAGSASLSMLPTVATRAGYHVRGQSSSRFPKTPYRIELRDNTDDDADYPMLGMPAEADWALIPAYYDRTLIRNPFIFTLGRDMGLQAPRTAYAEVFINYEARALERSDYQGVYWFTETIKNAKTRTNLKQLRKNDTTLPAISGGYIFKFDQAAAEEPELVCTGAAPISGEFRMPQGGGGTCWVDLEVVDPDPLVPEQEAWLTNYIQQFHDSLHATPVGDYAAYIDVSSFVDYLIINELSRNVDAYVRSSYYFKDRDGKINGGPLWDYNFSLALGGQSSIDPEGGFQYDGSRNVNNWFPKLTDDPAFMARVKGRWRELRQELYSDAALLKRVSDLSAPIANAVVRDYERWPVAQVYANPGIVRGSTVPTWEEQLEVLRDYLVRRAAWIDSQYR